MAAFSSFFRQAGKNMELLMYHCYTGLSVIPVPRRLYTSMCRGEDSNPVKEYGREVVDALIRGEMVTVRSSLWIAGIQ